VPSFRHSVVFRLVVGYGALVLFTVGLASAVFYVNTSGLLLRNVDRQLGAQSRQLAELDREHGIEAVVVEIHELLTDDKDIETENYLLLDAHGVKLIGNLGDWPAAQITDGEIFERPVSRLGKPSHSRLLQHHLSDGSVLVVGRDMRDLDELAVLIREALVVGIGVALLLTVAGAGIFRWQLERQLGVIHRATLEIGAGNLGKRLNLGDGRDEFARIGRDVNRMLDDIERLMNTARTVSNAIAHDLRTPLGRARSALENALRFDEGHLRDTARGTIDEIDGVIALFDRLLQIAEAEAGVRRQSFAHFSLAGVAADIVELYEPAAEQEEIALALEAVDDPLVLGDRDLVAHMLANLLDNAIKYAGRGTHVRVRITATDRLGRILVEDNGAGMPSEHIARATERFYRGDAGRTRPGNGLGLAIVSALVSLHEGTLVLEDAQPGLRVRIELPLAEA
jgi:signal transduction histidine kinase